MSFVKYKIKKKRQIIIDFLKLKTSNCLFLFQKKKKLDKNFFFFLYSFCFNFFFFFISTNSIVSCYSLSYVDKRPASTGSMHDGHMSDLTSQESMHDWWKVCMHGKYLIVSFTSKSIIQITHLKKIKQKKRIYF